jgi:hypothetical protein
LLTVYLKKGGGLSFVQMGCLNFSWGFDIAAAGRPVLNYLQITTKNARTSVLSSRWRCMWSECPRLSFDAVKICNSIRDDLHQHTDKFIHKVNAVLQKHQGKVVETFEIRIDFVDSLIHHLDNWIEFAVS